MRVITSVALVAITVLAPASFTSADQTGGPLTAHQWREDLTYLASTLETVHPDLFARVDRRLFEQRLTGLKEQIERLSPQEIALGMMQLVALAEDGHTSLEPIGGQGLGRWFPLRLYRFTDGIFITAIARPQAELAGAKVLRIGDLPAEEAWLLAATLLGSDNEFGALERAPLHLSNAAALRGLGIIDESNALRLELKLVDGSRETVEIEAVESAYDLSFQYWGEIWGPASNEVEYVTPFGKSDDHYDEASGLPWHLRYRSAFWSIYDETDKLFYVQINYMGDSSRREQTFAEFTDSVWKAVDELEVDRFVLDIRYNFGGDGSLVNPFVHELIKRDHINRKGTLFTIVGRATFSAGVMFARAMEEHTETTFVGEPMGAYWKSYGDGTSFELPNSGFVVWVSTIYHQLSSYAGNQRLLEIELPASFSSSDYLGRRDPALEEIHASRDRPLLANVFREQGGEAGLAAYEERLAAYGGVDWWAPFSLQSLNSLGHELLEAGRYEDALDAYRLNTERHPQHWRVWYSLARAQKRHGDLERAIENYEKALAADPFNNLAPYQREALAELRSSDQESP